LGGRDDTQRGLEDFVITLSVQLTDDPAAVAAWVKQYESLMQANGDRYESVASEEDEELAGELERFKANWPAYSGRFSRLHEGLVGLGYVPVLSKKMKPTSVRSYIAYALPGGRRVLENNSSTAYFVGKDLQDRLRGGHEWLNEGENTVSVQFDSEAKVDFVLELAAAEMSEGR
jgi:hypothetical protein